MLPVQPYPPSCATHHAAYRAAERYGIKASVLDWHGLLIDITDTVLGIRASAMLLRRERSGVERWLARLGPSAVIVIYDPNEAAVLTLLPADAKTAQHKVARHFGRSRRERPRAEIWD